MSYNVSVQGTGVPVDNLRALFADFINKLRLSGDPSVNGSWVVNDGQSVQQGSQLEVDSPQGYDLVKKNSVAIDPQPKVG